MIPEAPTRLLLSRLLLAALWAGILLAAASAPRVMASGGRTTAAALYLVTAPVCHQDPARSFTTCGYGWGLCHRCSGIYLGLLLGTLGSSLLSGLWYDTGLRRIWVVAGTAPIVTDFTLTFAGIWTNTAASRFTTGLAFGIVTGTLLVPALAELAASLSGSRRAAARACIQGGFQ